MRHPGARLLVALLVTVVGVVALVPGGTATAASGRCSVSVPQRVTVNAATERIRASLSAACDSAGVTYASWNVVNSAYGLQKVYIFDAGRSDQVWRFRDWQPKGGFELDPNAAYNDSGSVRQNRMTFEVRYAARISLTTHRAGRVVTLLSHATRFTSAGSHFRAIRDRRTFFSARDCRTCAWHRIGAVTTGRFGKSFLRLRSQQVRDYRAVVRGTSSVWGRTSRVSRR